MSKRSIILMCRASLFYYPDQQMHKYIYQIHFIYLIYIHFVEL